MAKKEKKEPSAKTLPSKKSEAPFAPKRPPKKPSVTKPVIVQETAEEKDARRVKKLKALADQAEKEGNDAAAEKLRAAITSIKAK